MVFVCVLSPGCKHEPLTYVLVIEPVNYRSLTLNILMPRPVSLCFPDFFLMIPSGAEVALYFTVMAELPSIYGHVKICSSCLSRCRCQRGSRNPLKQVKGTEFKNALFVYGLFSGLRGFRSEMNHREFIAYSCFWLLKIYNVFDKTHAKLQTNYN